jgi:hypothetical protein
LGKNVTDKEDTDDGVVLLAYETNVLFEVTQTSGGDVISVEIVEDVCERLDELV